MDFRAEYEKWCTDPYFDEATKAELKAIAGDDKEIEDRFYRTLEFGTAGLRGDNRSRHQQDEYIHSPSGYTGTGKLHTFTGRGRSKERRCNRA